MSRTEILKRDLRLHCRQALEEIDKAWERGEIVRFGGRAALYDLQPLVGIRVAYAGNEMLDGLRAILLALLVVGLFLLPVNRKHGLEADQRLVYDEILTRVGSIPEANDSGVQGIHIRRKGCKRCLRSGPVPAIHPPKRVLDVLQHLK